MFNSVAVWASSSWQFSPRPLWEADTTGSDVIITGGTKGGRKLQRRLQTVNMLSRTCIMLTGTTVCKILKFFIRSMALSTCTLTEAIFRPVRTSAAVSCGRLERNGGMFRRAPMLFSSSTILNPLSAITESPGSSFCKMPQSLVSCTSDIAPLYRRDTKVIIPMGAIPIRPLTVLWCLYEENKADCISLSDGCWTNISVASIITLVSGYLSLKTWGIVAWILSLDSHQSTEDRCRSRNASQVWKILETVLWEIFHLIATSSSTKPSLRRDSVIISSSMGSYCRFLPSFRPVWQSAASNLFPPCHNRKWFTTSPKLLKKAKNDAQSSNPVRNRIATSFPDSSLQRREHWICSWKCAHCFRTISNCLLRDFFSSSATCNFSISILLLLWSSSHFVANDRFSCCTANLELIWASKSASLLLVVMSSSEPLRANNGMSSTALELSGDSLVLLDLNRSEATWLGGEKRDLLIDLWSDSVSSLWPDLDMLGLSWIGSSCFTIVPGERKCRITDRFRGGDLLVGDKYSVGTGIRVRLPVAARLDSSWWYPTGIRVPGTKWKEHTLALSGMDTSSPTPKHCFHLRHNSTFLGKRWNVTFPCLCELKLGQDSMKHRTIPKHVRQPQ